MILRSNHIIQHFSSRLRLASSTRLSARAVHNIGLAPAFYSGALPSGLTAVLSRGTARCEESRLIVPNDDVSALKPLEQTTVRQAVARALRTIRRFLKLCLTLAPVVMFYPILLIQGKSKELDAQNIVLGGQAAPPPTGLLAAYLRLCLYCVESSGAAVIKLFQWASSRPDLFGHDFCSVFCSLQDDTTPHRESHTNRVLEEAFGKNWRERIRLEPSVIGSGCIGQVYKGKVQAKGETQNVAVKVLHPNVEADIEADLDLMRLAVRSLKYIPGDLLRSLEWMNLEGIVEEFAGLLKKQLDLRNEAAHLNQFNENFKDEPAVEFPKLIDGFTPTKDVLVESFCVGVPVLKFARAHQDDHEMMHKICRTGIRAVCKMIFLDNYVHADLHVGNVQISHDGRKFILFDVGIVAEYSDDDHRALVDILSAFIRKQGRVAAEHLIADSNYRLHAQGSDDDARNIEGFKDKIEALTIKAQGKNYFMEHLGTYITYICNAAADHHVMMNPSFVSAALAVKVQEGIALALYPSINLPKIAIPIIIQSERQREGIFKSASKMLGIDQWASSVVKERSN